jgi:hypothetical protein
LSLFAGWEQDAGEGGGWSKLSKKHKNALKTNNQ